MDAFTFGDSGVLPQSGSDPVSGDGGAKRSARPDNGADAAMHTEEAAAAERKQNIQNETDPGQTTEQNVQKQTEPGQTTEQNVQKQAEAGQKTETGTCSSGLTEEEKRAQTLAGNGCTYATGRIDHSSTPEQNKDSRTGEDPSAMAQNKDSRINDAVSAPERDGEFRVQSERLRTPVNPIFSEPTQNTRSSSTGEQTQNTRSSSVGEQTQNTRSSSVGGSAQNGYASYGARPPYSTAPRNGYAETAAPSDNTAAPAGKEPKKEKQVRRKNPIRFGTFVALFLVCLVTGTAAGSVSSYFVTKNILEKVPVVTQAQPQTQSGVQIDIYDHSGETGSSAPSSEVSTPAPGTEPVQPSSDAGVGSSASSVYKDNVDSVVNILGRGTQTVSFGFFFGGSSTQEFTSSGTGFLLTPDGYILTNYHVVEGCTSLSVTDYNGSEYPAKLVGFEETNDIAVLKVDGTGFHSVTLGESKNLEVGDSLMIIGNALGELNYSLTTGVVSYLRRSVRTETGSVINMFQTDAAINSGNSGGPVFNNKGEVVGIASAKYASSTIEGLGFCIPIDDVKDMILDIIDVGYVTGKPSIGVSLYTNAVPSRTLPRGCYVVAVGTATAADRAGIAVGDVITAINGKAIAEVDDVASALSSCRAGDTVTVSLSRNGGTLDVQVTLDEYAPSDTARTSYTNVFDY